MQAQPAAPQGASRIPNPYFAYGAPSGFAPLTDEAGVYLPTGPGDAQRMELLNMPGDGSDVWLDVRAVQLYLQISLTSIYKLEEYLQRAQQSVADFADGGDER